MKSLDKPVKTLRIIAMPDAVATRIRTTMKDDYGNDLTVQDGEGAPCRVCLRYGKAGERVILFSYKPFDAPALYQEIGPVFVHADICKPFPPDDDIPEDFANRSLILRPYTADHRIADSQITAQPGEALKGAAFLIENPDVAYVHARSVSRGCYLFKIERAV